jgi:hypothetical protein
MGHAKATGQSGQRPKVSVPGPEAHQDLKGELEYTRIQNKPQGWSQVWKEQKAPTYIALTPGPEV